MNLMDLIPTTDKLPTKTYSTAGALETKGKLAALKTLSADLPRDTMLQLSNNFRGIQDNLLRSIMHQAWDLPAELRGLNRTLDLAADSPKATTQALRQLADKLNFFIYPVDYMDDRAMGHTNCPREIRAAGTEFIESLKREKYNVFLVGPLCYYNNEKHIRSNTEISVYAPPIAAAAFIAISVSLPTFRLMFQQIGLMREEQQRQQFQIRNLDSRLTNVEEQQRQMNEQLKAVQTRMKELESYVQREQERQARASIAEEPMLIAIPNTKSIYDDGLAILGPCWGPEFDAKVVKALSLTAIPEQRKLLTAAAARWSPSSQLRNW